MAATMKQVASNFTKLEKFKGVDFRRWQKKMHFLISSMSVVGLILNAMSDSLFDVYQNVETFKELWDTLEAKYMAEDASRGIDSLELGSHMRIKESLRSQDNDKPKGNKGAKHSIINMVEHNNSSRYNDNKGKRKHHDNIANPNKKPKVTCWKCGKPGHLKKDCKAGNDDDVVWWIDSRAIMHVCKDRCWFKTYESLNDGSILHMGNESTALMKNLVSSSVLNNCGYKHGVFIGFGYLSKNMFRLNIVSDNIGSAFMSTSKLKDSILWHARLGHVHFKRMQDMSKDGLISAFDMDTKKYRFSSVPRPNQRSLVKGTKNSGGSVVPEKVIDAIVQQSEPELRTRKRHRTPKNFGPVFHLYLIEGTRDEVSDQHSYCFKVNDDPKTFDEAMKSRDVAFWKKAINDEMDSIMGNNTWVLTDLPPGCKPLGCKWIFKRKLKVDLTKDFLSSRFSMKDMREVDVILGILVTLVLSTVLEGYTDASWISNIEDNSSTSGWVFLLASGAISWASKKQTCITGSTMEYEFVALSAASKEAEWLKNLLLEIPLWVKPITPISIRCNSAATLAKTYS
nr:zinc finger, CCHC-type [Tanacetum cinerariifolium]